ncbi:hypothetical protein BMJ13_08030 [Staphylococcus saprophyticus]|uniref:hypothetical protein n=1 Tax=Staphylococcus saprophyticus TaxID=29385 RepID=UPI00094B8235|nr:hypothetical protein [Staphylococcus saprophyticus]OLN92934.1 hypothetical protein BMJ13_08030 [Staphylococcus saprophyticus]
MVKIKQKKTMNLPQLIEWAWENDITNKKYICNEFEKKSVIFNLSGWAEFSDEFSYNPEDTFTVEVEEEITEDTEISILAHYSVFGFKTTKSNASINEEKGGNSIAFYIMNDDKTMTLIWKNGKLVD